MSSGLYASASGIRAHQTRMNVISNNIANVNTLGFKSSLVNFSDVFSNTISGGSPPNGTLGGTNPKQIGNGTLVQEISKDFSQGGTQFTGRSTDMMINGNGFFVVERIDNTLGVGGSGFFLTRAGNFSLDSEGNLATPSGQRIRGTSQLNGTSPSTITNVNIPQELTIVKDFDVNNNIIGTHLANNAVTPAAVAAAATVGTTSQVQTAVKLVNFSLGSGGGITATYSNGDILSIRVDQNTQVAGNPQGARTELIHRPADGNGIFGPDLSSPGGGLPDGNPSQIGDLGLLDQIAGFGVLATPPGGDGLEGAQLNLQTATVVNPGGLQADGSNNFLLGPNAGAVSFGQPGSENRGLMVNGSLESSNVDIAGQFTDMIITQRGLESNSRMIRAQSEVLQNIINSV